MYQKYTSKMYGFYATKGYGLWVMGYEWRSPAYQLGNLKNVWGMREYGLSELWVKRASTVLKRLRNGHKRQE